MPDDTPPPAYFVRVLPVTPLGAWLRARLATQGPFVAAVVIASAAGLGVGMGLSPSCPPAPALHDPPARPAAPPP
ncbi:hypothetical protein Sru01_53700 [Sphaerisporangium rufum]|uniref:Uncharacterized protein n=1 Tax=Sphaerisporangium rufum TaxID=1381558 RepID=A0A919R6X9_9ACTN|nr:hypothetical protein [Sphaerisporangium rufum]GII80388.1 hypothetical protein Sru01_53700 [Sphaerisporangium rufum]